MIDYGWADKVAFHACRRFRAMHLVDDAQSAARIALWKCSETFDPSHGCSLQQYAQRRVFGSVVDALRTEQFLSTRGHKPHGCDVLPLKSVSSIASRQTIPEAEHIDVMRSVNMLPPRCKYVIRRRFMDDADGVEISRELGVKRARVSQILRQSFDTMRMSL